MRRRRSFGAVRRLPSNRWQARYRGEDGRLHSAPGTFASCVDAERFLAQLDLERVRGGWVDPDAGAVPLATYVEQWLVERPTPLRPRTVELYRGLLRLHISPTFGPVHLNRITSASVRSWHASLRQRGVGDSTVAKAYRLLKGILNTAVDDDLIGRNRAGCDMPEQSGRTNGDHRRSARSMRSLRRSTRGSDCWCCSVRGLACGTANSRD